MESILLNQYKLKTFLHATTALQQFVLYSEAQTSVVQKHQATDKPILWRSSLGQLLAVRLKDCIPQDLLHRAQEIATSLTQWKRFPAKNVDGVTIGTFLVSSSSNVDRCNSIGCWTSKSGKDELYSTTSLADAKDKTEKMLAQMEIIAREIGDVIGKTIETHPLTLVNGILAAVPTLLGDNAKLGISSTLYLNRMNLSLGSTKAHLDTHDCHGCFVVPFGEYEGGDLAFPQLRQRVQLAVGDCIWFDSSHLQHCNEAVTFGTRYSMVFATHTRVVRLTLGLPPPPPKPKRKTNKRQKEKKRQSTKQKTSKRQKANNSQSIKKAHCI